MWWILLFSSNSKLWYFVTGSRAIRSNHATAIDQCKCLYKADWNKSKEFLWFTSNVMFTWYLMGAGGQGGWWMGIKFLDAFCPWEVYNKSFKFMLYLAFDGTRDVCSEQRSLQAWDDSVTSRRALYRCTKKIILATITAPGNWWHQGSGQS